MVPNKPNFSIEDCIKCKWEELISQVNQRDFHHYNQIFHQLSDESKNKNEEIKSEIFVFLAEITSPFGLELHSEFISCECRNNYFKRLKTDYEKIFSETHFEILGKLALDTSDPEMKARMVDILWICKRSTENNEPIDMAKLAIESYLQAAQNLEASDNWLTSTKRLYRAAQLAVMIDNRSVKMRQLVAQHIDNLINRYKDMEIEFLTGGAMQVLQKDLRKSLKDLFSDVSVVAIQYAKIAAKKATWSNSQSDYHQGYHHAISYHQIEAEWYKIARHRESERNARILIAEVEAWYGQKAIDNKEPNQWIVTAGRISNAIEAFKKIEDSFGSKDDTSARIEELHRKMLEYQKKFMSEIEIIVNDDFNDFNDADARIFAKDLVSGKTVLDSLKTLACVFPSSILSMDKLESKAKQQINSNLLSRILPTVHLDEQGKTKSISADDNDKLKESMFAVVKDLQCFCVLILFCLLVRKFC